MGTAVGSKVWTDLKSLSSPWRALFPLTSCFTMAVKNELDWSSSWRRLWLPVLRCTVLLEVEGMLPWALVDWRIVTCHNCHFSASCPCVRQCRQQNSQWRYLPSALAFCLLPQTHCQMLLWVHSQDIALMKLLASAVPAVVCVGIVYSAVNLITFYQF